MISITGVLLVCLLLYFLLLSTLVFICELTIIQTTHPFLLQKKLSRAIAKSMWFTKIDSHFNVYWSIMAYRRSIKTSFAENLDKTRTSDENAIALCDAAGTDHSQAMCDKIGSNCCQKSSMSQNNSSQLMMGFALLLGCSP